ncbi:MAG TPA: DUF2252 domain-containing protein [Microbacteriaceae bacterium]|nr:DUF2252 domain-containing protein [Microbacteriaceae bacterium]
MSELGWERPPTSAERRERGRTARTATPRRELARVTTAARDPLGILAAQDTTRVPELVPLRAERMAASPFAFYRGTAALMAADLADAPHSGIVVASCGDAHVANFGLYASAQRTLVFDLNDFDEAAWAPWEWDLKRLVTSVVIGGRASSRDAGVVENAVRGAIRAYSRALAASVRRSPTERYFSHFDAAVAAGTLDPASRKTLNTAIKEARQRTGERATRKLTEVDGEGRRRFVHQPPTLGPVEPDIIDRIHRLIAAYLTTASADIAHLLVHYRVADIARRVVGVGSVGTRCYLALFQDGDDHTLLLQPKQAMRSVLEEYGRIPQPPVLDALIERGGEGARVVALQRILQALSDPFLGHLRGERGDYYIRQFHDMKGGIDAETLDDEPFVTYAQACAVTLARAHSQSLTACDVTGYIGRGTAVEDALTAFAYAYADVSLRDYEAFVAARAQ